MSILSTLPHNGPVVWTPISKGYIFISVTSKLPANPRPLGPLPGALLDMTGVDKVRFSLPGEFGFCSRHKFLALAPSLPPPPPPPTPILSNPFTLTS